MLVLELELDITLFHVVCIFTVRWRYYFVDITVTIETLLNKLASNLQIIVEKRKVLFLCAYRK
jgi:hypothetical protein